MHRSLPLVLALLAGCATNPALPARTPALPATWSLDASAYRGQNGTRLIFQCPPNPGRTDVGSVWGSDIYSDDSSICAAGVHAGAITFEQGGRVAVTITPGRSSYDASSRHGVASSPWGEWSGSFTVVAG